MMTLMKKTTSRMRVTRSGSAMVGGACDEDEGGDLIGVVGLRWRRRRGIEGLSTRLLLSSTRLLSTTRKSGWICSDMVRSA